MPKKSYRQAINEALRQEMERDPRVILMGEDVSGGMGAPGEDDAWGGPLGVTKGLEPIFGRDRVLDTPITESAFIGCAAGAAATGLRPQFPLPRELSSHPRNSPPTISLRNTPHRFSGHPRLHRE